MDQCHIVWTQLRVNDIIANLKPYSGNLNKKLREITSGAGKISGNNNLISNSNNNNNDSLTDFSTQNNNDVSTNLGIFCQIIS